MASIFSVKCNLLTFKCPQLVKDYKQTMFFSLSKVKRSKTVWVKFVLI